MFGKRHGFGKYHYGDGGRYEGEWVDDKIDGKGKSVYANGNVYEGDVRAAANAMLLDMLTILCTVGKWTYQWFWHAHLRRRRQVCAMSWHASAT